MLKYCEINHIGNGEYLFKSHDFRHNVATMYYDNEVSIQSVRDYLGHDYEEMTRQYIDYMPQKISKANEKYFEQEEHGLASGIKRLNVENKIYIRELESYQSASEKKDGDKFLF